MRGGGVGRLVVHPYGSVKAAVMTPTWVIRKDEGISGGALEMPRGGRESVLAASALKFCFGQVQLLTLGNGGFGVTREVPGLSNTQAPIVGRHQDKHKHNLMQCPTFSRRGNEEVYFCFPRSSFPVDGKSVV